MRRASLAANRSVRLPGQSIYESAVWPAVDELVERAAHFDDLRAHGLHLLAARRHRALGLNVPNQLLGDERLAAAVVLGATVALERARDAYEGPMLLLKGLEVAMRYQAPTLRPFRDVDLLVEQPETAHEALIAAGFAPIGPDSAYYDHRHHLRPLVLPGHPVFVELHRRPVWVSWASPPEATELFSEAVPSATGIKGILAPAPAHHALIVAAHSWSGAPLRRILDLVDALLLAQESDPTLLAETSRRWQLDGVWRTMTAATSAVLLGRPALPWHVRLWAGDVIDVRERTVFVNHVRRVVGPFSALPFPRSLPVAAKAIWQEFRPLQGESPKSKAVRSVRAISNASKRVSAHDQDHGRQR